jgi:hypothetical protein
MTLTEDYFTKLIILVEASEDAFSMEDYEEAKEYMEEIRDISEACLEELESLRIRIEEDGEDEVEHEGEFLLEREDD